MSSVLFSKRKKNRNTQRPDILQKFQPNNKKPRQQNFIVVVS